SSSSPADGLRQTGWPRGVAGCFGPTVACGKFPPNLWLEPTSLRSAAQPQVVICSGERTNFFLSI
ncbi:MAG: hypothetical protein ACUVR2_04670, partial [Anaerolineae bacterium]